VYVWELSVPQLVRPLWVFNNLSPEIPAIEPLQRDVGLTTSFEGVGFMDGLTSSSLFWWVVLAGGVRAVLTTVAHRRDPLAAQAVALPPTAGGRRLSVPDAARRQIEQGRVIGHPPPLAWLTGVIDRGAAAPPGPWTGLGTAALKAVGSALVIAAVLAGVTTTTVPDFASRQWLGMLTAFAVAALVRSIGLGFLPAYVRAVNRVPVVVRILACGLVAQIVADDLVEDALLANDTDFSSLLVPMLVSVGLAAVLIPGRRPTEIATAGAPA
jgi:hypothetical protein